MMNLDGWIVIKSGDLQSTWTPEVLDPKIIVSSVRFCMLHVRGLFSMPPLFVKVDTDTGVGFHR